MQAERSAIAQMLASKDDQVEGLDSTLRGYEYVRQNKHAFMVSVEEDSRYNKVLMASCVKPCFKHLESNVIATDESECLTNCMAKGLEVQTMFKFMNADQDMKRFGGFRG